MFSPALLKNEVEEAFQLIPKQTCLFWARQNNIGLWDAFSPKKKKKERLTTVLLATCICTRKSPTLCINPVITYQNPELLTIRPWGFHQMRKTQPQLPPTEGCSIFIFSDAPNLLHHKWSSVSQNWTQGNALGLFRTTNTHRQQSLCTLFST